MGKSIQLLCPTGKDARCLRRRLGMNQADFWHQVSVTQSGGSRYESGRTMPIQVAWALHLVFSGEQQANKLLQILRMNVPGVDTARRPKTSESPNLP